jgi:hypothetical protein
MIDRDKLNNSSADTVFSTTYGLVDRLQGSPAHIQAAATAVLFLTVAKVHGIDPQDVFAVASKMMTDPIAGEHPNMRALRSYAKHELT